MYATLLPELSRNEQVHYPMLELALESFAGVAYENVYGGRRGLILYLMQRLILSSTNARVLPTLAPRHASGDILQSPIVDYTINLQPDEEMDDVIRGLLRSQPKASRPSTRPCRLMFGISPSRSVSRRENRMRMPWYS